MYALFMPELEREREREGWPTDSPTYSLSPLVEGTQHRHRVIFPRKRLAMVGDNLQI